MGDSTPICRCRVLYLGSAVPRQSKDGLQGIQEPLKGLYPPEGAAGARGIDSWLSVWSNGILLENVDENRKQVTRFFPIDSLHYCAAVRHVLVPERGQSAPEPKFLPLDSPFARTPRAAHPPLFAAILRRTTGIKVLECHAFICKREAAANALVRCCFHAYADSSYARQAETGNGSVYGSLIRPVGYTSRAGSTTTINSVGRHPVTPATVHQDAYASSADLGLDDGSICNGDENHKVWTGSQDRLDEPDGIYDIYSGGGSTLSRPARARQVSAPVQIAPPPISEKEKKKRQKRSNGHASSASLAGTMMRPRPAPGQIMRGPGPVLYYPTQGVPIPVPGPHVRHFHTFSHRNRPPPPMMPMPMMVPQYAPQPQFAPQYPQYATLQAPKVSKKKRNKERNGVVPLAPVAPIFAYPPTIERPLAHSNRKLAHSTASGLEEISAQTNGDVSPNGTGIYRRKGHLNERAFSYSIRQEHRSRSHGSLASLQFAPAPSLPPTNAEGREDLKKEREIMQLVAGLDLNGGPERPEHHRRDVPPMQIPPNMAAGAYGKVRR